MNLEGVRMGADPARVVAPESLAMLDRIERAAAGMTAQSGEWGDILYEVELASTGARGVYHLRDMLAGEFGESEDLMIVAMYLGCRTLCSKGKGAALAWLSTREGFSDKVSVTWGRVEFRQELARDAWAIRVRSEDGSSEQMKAWRTQWLSLGFSHLEIPGDCPSNEESLRFLGV